MTFGNVLDFLWPRYCAGCGRPVDRPCGHFCSECLDRLPFVPTQGLCRRCGRDTGDLDVEYQCIDCRGRHPPHYDRAGSALRFDGKAREIINAFKFRRAFFLRNDFADFLSAAARVRFKVDEIDFVSEIPATRQHRFLRGYNPAGILADAMASRLNKPRLKSLRRIGSPKRQGGLDEESRHENVKGTFAVRGNSVKVKLVGRTILLVDDIMTTGATFSEAAKTLKAVGAKRVWTLSLARSVRY